MLILIFVWLISAIRLPLRSTSRSRAVVARRAHNPKVGSSNLPFATRTASQEAYFFETWGLISRQSRDGSRDAANAGRDADLKRLHSNLPSATKKASQEAYFFETWGLISRQSRDGSRDAASACRDADLKRLHSNLRFATRTSQGAFIFAQRSG